MKKILIFILGIFLVAVLSFYYYVLWSPYGRRTQANADNLKKIGLGMSKDQMLQIMGKPDSVFPSYYNDGLIIYQYEPPFGSSDGIDLYLDSLGTVKRIIFE